MIDGKPTVLVVDDEPFNVEIILEYIGSENYDLKDAEDGLDAWTQLEADPEAFDVVVLDRMMPNMDGMEVLKRINAHPILKEVPVILQTALASKSDIADGMQAGAFYYLTKPFEEEMLRSVIETAVSDRQRYLTMKKKVDVTTKDHVLLLEGIYTLKTLEEATELSTTLSNACPDPQRVIIGISELLINAVEHGNLGITYDEKGELKEDGTWNEEVMKRLEMPEHKDKVVTVKVFRDDEKVNFLIIDEGNGFDHSKYLEMDPDRAFDNHGRGIAMSRMLSFDHFEYQGVGNQILVGVNLKAE